MNRGASARASGSVWDRVLNTPTVMMTGGPSPYRSNAIIVPSADTAVFIGWSSLLARRRAGIGMSQLSIPQVLRCGQPPADVIAYDFAAATAAGMRGQPVTRAYSA